MTIHTTPPEKTEYVKIVGQDDVSYRPSYAGCYGIVTAYAKKQKMVFATVKGQPCVFAKGNIQYVTKKEYFLGVLGG